MTQSIRKMGGVLTREPVSQSSSTAYVEIGLQSQVGYVRIRYQVVRLVPSSSWDGALAVLGLASSFASSGLRVVILPMWTSKEEASTAEDRAVESCPGGGVPTDQLSRRKSSVVLDGCVCESCDGAGQNFCPSRSRCHQPYSHCDDMGSRNCVGKVRVEEGMFGMTVVYQDRQVSASCEQLVVNSYLSSNFLVTSGHQTPRA